ncbi:amidohydrolase family protein [Candidatus Woesearchaeota archaeon]|nr:amidohydrolase family protein [Candidatus Woesearchaeota archaeon]
MAPKMTCLESGLAFVGGKIVKKNICIYKGRIAAIADSCVSGKRGMEKIDCTGKLILPGIIDSHVHFREPGMAQKEDFSTGSKAAAAGGITTVLDMPNNRPPVLTVRELEKKRKIAKKKCLVNYGFHFGSSKDNIREIKKAKNTASTKIFMNISTGDMKIEDENQLENIFRASKVIAVHAEGSKVKQAVELAKKTGKRLYLCHISSETELRYLKRNKPKNIFIEATPHHLYLKSSKSPFLDVKPRLKSDKDKQALWKAVSMGLIDTIGSDHAPHTIKEKKSKNPPSGMPGEETMLPLMLDAVNRRKMALRKLVQLCSENPAKIFGIKNKGCIKEGHDADLTVVDMHLKKKVDSVRFFTKCGWSAFNNKLLKGWPVMTIVNGNIVFDNGKINSKIKGKEVIFAEAGSK